MQQKLPLLKTFSMSHETLLIKGDSGVGKSRLARWCHANSKRRYGAFEVLDLATIPDEMKMGALFGWKKGAYTGAMQSNPGAVGRAMEGTLFIDEIDKLSMEAQAGLLQLLDGGYYQPLGDRESLRKADIRFIIGTNANLQTLVREGRFREDLYYRINVLPVNLLPLSQRPDEIVPWAEYMLHRCLQTNQSDRHVTLSSSAKQRLEHCPWPGNLRQLDTIVRRADAICRSENQVKSPAAKHYCIDDTHITQALMMDGSSMLDSRGMSGDSIEKNLQCSMWKTAELFVELAMKKDTQQKKLCLSLADTFKAHVLNVALAKLMDKKLVYQLFGREKAILNRTYQRELRKELERIEEFEHAIGR
ncbi:sigma-54-dependent Fis family transcriptional regulator [Paraneptunicella aestuarii]|uniref:sigma-54-dependent transcriptional regulator n=1 Tax=Paraneptunicella aestuarii TaxID=2831148 RepID=UPI001E58B6D5|nr:sigma 54-interacting transcriptional regulator [Paraneptunicella aestuarii]UAA39169.1 sigma-54-dependent Fis family transcriptional regulator [Paraneptunicella aestuarii]